VTGYPYRFRYRFRYRRGSDGRGLMIAGAALAALLAASGAKTAGHHAAIGRAAAGTAAASAIAYARQQIGKPYCWGGTGGGCFDCSGLVQQAYAHAGISIARTSQAQWASEQHVPASRVQAGDLVFYPGADGTWASPGHVGIVIGGGQMIEAYATGYPIRVTAIRPGMVGYAQPQGGA
jgi:cell wall-associated NlpC family hydrolase